MTRRTVEGDKHVEKAMECLEAANVLLDAGLASAAVSRVYYALFHSMVALLRDEGINLGQHKHVHIVKQFKACFIDTCKFPASTLATILHAKALREQSDYSVTMVLDEATARHMLRDAARVVDDLAGTRAGGAGE